MVRKLLFPLIFVIRHLRNKLLLGLLVAIPLMATIWLLVWAFNAVDNIIQPIVKTTWGKTYPGIGVGVVVILTYLFGILASSIFGRRIVVIFLVPWTIRKRKMRRKFTYKLWKKKYFEMEMRAAFFVIFILAAATHEL